MNLSIQTATRQHVVDFHMEIQSLSSFHDTALTLKGEFGQVAFHKMDFANCHTWILHADVTENILIKGASAEKVLQLLVTLPPLFEERLNSHQEQHKGTPLPTIGFSFSDCPQFELDTSVKKMLVFHYASPYFTDAHTHLLEQLLYQQLLLSRNITANLKADAAFIFVLQQVLSFPPEDIHRPRYIKAKTEELLVHFLKLAETAMYSLRDFSLEEIEKLQQVINLVQAAIGENFSDFQLAKKAGINVYTLKKKFKAYTGTTIYQFLLKTRMETAQRLLQETDTSINEIATTCGYKNLSNFSETFKKYYGVSPNTYRKRH